MFVTKYSVENPVSDKMTYRNRKLPSSGSFETKDDNFFTYSNENFIAQSEAWRKFAQQHPPVVTSLGTSVHETCREFALRTTAHGWHRVSSASSRAVKVLWLIVSITALVCSAVHVAILVTNYRDFPSEVEWRVTIAEITFPSVSICNVQPVSATSAEELLRDNTSRFYAWNELTNRLADYESVLDGEKLEQLLIVEGRLRQSVGCYENIGNESQLVGHQAPDFIVGCSFSQSACSWRDFAFFHNAQFFNCYTFNGEYSDDVSVIRTMSGPYEGLSLVLYLEHDNGNDFNEATYYTGSKVGNAAGVRVLVHPPYTRPSPLDQGIDIPPGHSASLGLSRKRYSRLGSRYGDCVEHESPPTNGEFAYSRHNCILQCQQHAVRRECNCVSALLPHDVTDNDNFCGRWLDAPAGNLTTYWRQIQCEKRVLSTYLVEAEMEACGCDPACTETIYTSELSMSSWPLHTTQVSFFEQHVLGAENASERKAYANLAAYNESELLQKDLVSRNFARVNVYLKSTTIEEYIEKAGYQLPSLFSDIGGVCGLWIGMSIITWCEVVELVGLLLHRVFKHTTRS